MDHAEALQANNKIVVRPMSVFAEFFLRFLKTSYSFQREERKLVILLHNPEGLSGITVAVPRYPYLKPVDATLSVQEDDLYYMITVRTNEKDKTIIADMQ